MPGAMPMVEVAKEVTAEWERQAKTGTLAKETVTTHSNVLNTLIKFAAARGLTLVCDLTNEPLNEWMFAANAYTGQPVTDTTARLRRNVATSFFYTCFQLGITDVNPATMLPNLTRRGRFVSPFTPDEIDRLKESSVFAWRETKSPAALALALLGAAPGEVGCITCADVRLTDMLVRAHGGGTRYAERWLPIDDSWCFEQLAARLTAISRKHPEDWQSRYVAYEPLTDSEADFLRRSAATSMTLTKVIAKAGLKKNGVRRVASIAEYVACRIFAETGRIEAVAARLGINKLDDVAHIVGYEWKTEYLIAGPDPREAGEPS